MDMNKRGNILSRYNMAKADDPTSHRADLHITDNYRPIAKDSAELFLAYARHLGPPSLLDINQCVKNAGLETDPQTIRAHELHGVIQLIAWVPVARRPMEDIFASNMVELVRHASYKDVTTGAIWNVRVSDDDTRFLLRAADDDIEEILRHRRGNMAFAPERVQASVLTAGYATAAKGDVVKFYHGNRVHPRGVVKSTGPASFTIESSGETIEVPRESVISVVDKSPATDAEKAKVRYQYYKKIWPGFTDDQLKSFVKMSAVPDEEAIRVASYVTYGDLKLNMKQVGRKLYPKVSGTERRAIKAFAATMEEWPVRANPSPASYTLINACHRKLMSINRSEDIAEERTKIPFILSSLTSVLAETMPAEDHGPARHDYEQSVPGQQAPETEDPATARAKGDKGADETSGPGRHDYDEDISSKLPRGTDGDPATDVAKGEEDPDHVSGPGRHDYEQKTKDRGQASGDPMTDVIKKSAAASGTTYDFKSWVDMHKGLLVLRSVLNHEEQPPILIPFFKKGHSEYPDLEKCLYKFNTFRKLRKALYKAMNSTQDNARRSDGTEELTDYLHAMEGIIKSGYSNSPGAQLDLNAVEEAFEDDRDLDVGISRMFDKARSNSRNIQPYKGGRVVTANLHRIEKDDHHGAVSKIQGQIAALKKKLDGLDDDAAQKDVQNKIDSLENLLKGQTKALEKKASAILRGRTRRPFPGDVTEASVFIPTTMLNDPHSLNNMILHFAKNNDIDMLRHMLGEGKKARGLRLVVTPKLRQEASKFDKVLAKGVQEWSDKNPEGLKPGVTVKQFLDSPYFGEVSYNTLSSLDSRFYSEARALDDVPPLTQRLLANKDAVKSLFSFLLPSLRRFTHPLKGSVSRAVEDAWKQTKKKDLELLSGSVKEAGAYSYDKYKEYTKGCKRRGTAAKSYAEWSKSARDRDTGADETKKLVKQLSPQQKARLRKQVGPGPKKQTKSSKRPGSETQKLVKQLNPQQRARLRKQVGKTSSVEGDSHPFRLK